MQKLETNRDVLLLKRGLDAVPEKVSFNNEKKSVATFKFIISNNKRNVNNYVKDMNAVSEPSTEFKDYRKEDRELSERFCSRDENGKAMQFPIGLPEQQMVKYIIHGEGDPESEYSMKLAALKEKYKGTIEEMEKKEKDFDDYLKEKVDLEKLVLAEIDYNQVPLENLPQKAIDGLIFIIRDPEGTEQKKKPQKTKQS